MFRFGAEFSMVFGNAAEAGDATDVAPTNIPAHSAPNTLFLRIDIAFPFRWTSLIRRWGAVMR
jgi:hypothetical protein